MDKFTLSQVTHDGISQAMALANKKLQQTTEQKFERNFLELIHNEIKIGTNAADNFRFIIHGAPEYTYTNVFPLSLYEALTE